MPKPGFLKAAGGPLSLPTLDREGGRRHVHPVTAKGRFRTARGVVAVLLIAIFLGLPHLSIGGRPAFLIDIGRRQLSLFGATFFATELFSLAVIGIGSVVAIALFTALFGRVWCGWACPQTIYLEFLYRPFEGLFDGPPAVRSRMASTPMTVSRGLRKLGKWAVYLLIALLLANTFVAYFIPTGELFAMVRSDPRDNWTAFLAMAIVTGLVAFDFGWFREQTCIIACPYGRLQSVLIDAQSIVVGYDAKRGEPRKKAIDRDVAGDGSGDCVDCLACVRTCPTSIDIREGLQLECIGCTQCIDACDAIMVRLKKPKGLVRYTSLDELQGKTVKFFRPRLAFYAALMFLAIGVLAFGMYSREAFEFDIVRMPGTTFYTQPDGLVVNRVRLRVTNRLTSDQQVDIRLTAPEGAEFLSPPMPIQLPGRAVVPVEGIVRMPKSAFGSVGGRIPAKFTLNTVNGKEQQKNFVLLGPIGGAP